jgi:hypothetical protein
MERSFIIWTPHQIPIFTVSDKGRWDGWDVYHPGGWEISISCFTDSERFYC